MGSQLPLPANLEPFPVLSLHDSLDHQLPQDGNFQPRPRTVPTIPPGFEGTVPSPGHESKPSEMNVHIRVALLEQDLRIRHAQLDEAMRANAHLTKLHQKEGERVFALVQELNHCEQRTAKAEIAVEYLAGLNLQIAAQVKQHEEPDQQVSALQEQLKHANHDAESRISSLETEIQNLSQDNEKLKSKLENAMDTILILSSYASTVQTPNPASQAFHPVGTVPQHNNLIDLMDDCLTPIKSNPVEELTTTLLDESYDPDEDDIPALDETPKVSSDFFDSDFSNSSYIVRFKGIRDMTKEVVKSDKPSEVWAL